MLSLGFFSNLWDFLGKYLVFCLRPVAFCVSQPLIQPDRICSVSNIQSVPSPSPNQVQGSSTWRKQQARQKSLLPKFKSSRISLKPPACPRSKSLKSSKRSRAKSPTRLARKALERLLFPTLLRSFAFRKRRSQSVKFAILRPAK